ncbi:hypothetical protein BYT27DRAFT_7225037 [Phlegmacium glaucopus]|nr:hypothetical protein BYT27DRAFT_7225037 [Phlegmacium glaucopus]
MCLGTPTIAILLSNICDIDLASTNKLWLYLRDVVWHYAETTKVVDERFRHYGKDLGFSSLYPPVNYCINGQCKPAAKGLKLQKMDQTQGVLYTLDKGVHPVWVIRFQCVECQRVYYHNYFMKDGMWYYYDGDLPDVIQVGEHQFIERKVVNVWCTDMNVARKSFTNCAHTYKISLSGPNCLPTDWPFKAALKDHLECNTTLIVPHTGDQAGWFMEAIKARNMCFKIYGQNEVVAVMDGMTLGHPCCTVHNCKTPLATSCDRYCPTHHSLSNICAINNCTLPRDIDIGDLIDNEEEEEFEINDNDYHLDLIHGVINHISDLCGASPMPIGIAPCGMILVHETFFRAEEIETCADQITFFFDNNYSLAKHIKNDPFFKDIGLTVDIFHFNCKHSVKDKFCYCNPIIYTELHGENSKAWYFNSSIAEQTNVWLGGFHAILHEMLVERYNFFLDKMILLQNRMTHNKLQKEGHCPFTITNT